MKKIVRLTESDLNRIIKRVLKEDIDFDVKDSRFGKEEIDSGNIEFDTKNRDFGKEEIDSGNIDRIIELAYQERNSGEKRWVKLDKGISFSPNGGSLFISNIDLETFPDVSKYKKLRNISVTDCNLKSLPPASFLPKKLISLTISNSDITEVDIEDYISLKELMVLNLLRNPIEWINAKVINKMQRNGLTRFLFDGKPEGSNELKGWFKPK